jgi:hypothetical protein
LLKRVLLSRKVTLSFSIKMMKILNCFSSKWKN